MTVRELRELLYDYPDDMIVSVSTDEDESEYDIHTFIPQCNPNELCIANYFEIL